MSDNTDQMVTTVTDHQHEEVDYADPESPTLAVPQYTSTTTGTDERPTDVVERTQTGPIYYCLGCVAWFFLF